MGTRIHTDRKRIKEKYIIIIIDISKRRRKAERTSQRTLQRIRRYASLTVSFPIIIKKNSKYAGIEMASREIPHFSRFLKKTFQIILNAGQKILIGLS